MDSEHSRDLAQKPLVYFNHRFTHKLHDELLKMVEDVFTVIWPHSEELETRKNQIEGMIVYYGCTIKDSKLLDQFPALKAISSTAVGYDNIDVALCASRGIKVYACNLPGTSEDATADLGFALLLASARRIREGDMIGHDPSNTFFDNLFGYEVSGSTLGIVGMGKIGCRVARRALGFDMKILYNKRTRQDESVEKALSAEYCPSLHDMLPRCDFVMLIIPGTKENEKMFSTREFQAMKRSAVFVNIGRGSVVDQEAMARALSEGTIAAAGVDVTSPESLPRDHPLLQLPNLTITPHMGSATLNTRRKITRLMIENLLCGLEGRPCECEVTK